MTLALSSCSAVSTAIKKRNLDVQTKMSETIFLNPVSTSMQTVYVQIKNTSDKQDLKVKQLINQKLTEKGYKVVSDLGKAHYLIQANILRVAKSNLREKEALFASAYGAGITGTALAGLAYGGLGGHSGSSLMGAGLIGSVVGVAADALVDDTYYTMVTDVQISERVGAGVKVHETNQGILKQGTSGAKFMTSSRQTDWERYQTRVISSANQVNLDFKDAIPTLENGLANAVAGIL
ncbi:complement resistance protein TraT [Photobacterium damselae subsp. piscicida]|nr:complement resistance protein TraT [Photobacterium damselae subsp. piscicida]